MDYTMAMNYINEKNKLGQVPGLVNVKELLNRLDNPQNKCRCLHIAGTNGKGSIFAFIQEVLIAEGYKVGRYISPTILDYRERFQVNKKYISEEDFSHYLTRVAKKVEAMVSQGYDSPTAFEIETAVGFLYFADSSLDYVLIECGMGGALDATNVIEEPVLAVMASISMDHMQFLGDSVEEITINKAGIIKSGGVCVSYPQSKEALACLKQECIKRDASLILADEASLFVDKMDIAGTSFTYKNKKYRISLLGEHQVYNAITAIETLEYLRCSGATIRDDSIEAGLLNTNWIGRMTKLKEQPYIFVDGAHNLDAWNRLAENLNKYFTNRKIIYIIGVLKDKDYHSMIDILGPTMSYAVAITPNTPRGLDKDILASLLKEKGIAVDVADTRDEAVNKALSCAEAEDVVMISGSLSFINDYISFFNFTC